MAVVTKKKNKKSWKSLSSKIAGAAQKTKSTEHTYAAIKIKENAKKASGKWTVADQLLDDQPSSNALFDILKSAIRSKDNDVTLAFVHDDLMEALSEIDEIIAALGEETRLLDPYKQPK